MNIEESIKALLRAQGKTQQELCRAIGFSYGALRNSYARNSMETSVLGKVAEFLGVPISELLEDGAPKYMNNNSLNTINDSDTIGRLVGIIEEKDRQISRLMDIIDKKNDT